jgi:hypothetical protein
MTSFLTPVYGWKADGFWVRSTISGILPLALAVAIAGESANRGRLGLEDESDGDVERRCRRREEELESGVPGCMDQRGRVLCCVENKQQEERLGGGAYRGMSRLAFKNGFQVEDLWYFGSNVSLPELGLIFCKHTDPVAAKTFEQI